MRPSIVWFVARTKRAILHVSHTCELSKYSIYNVRSLCPILSLSLPPADHESPWHASVESNSSGWRCETSKSDERGCAPCRFFGEW